MPGDAARQEYGAPARHPKQLARGVDHDEAGDDEERIDAGRPGQRLQRFKGEAELRRHGGRVMLGMERGDR